MKRDKQKEMKLNKQGLFLERMLGTWKVILLACMLQSFFLFALLSYGTNLILHLKEVVTKKETLDSWLSLKNILPDVQMIPAYPELYRTLLVFFLLAVVFLDVRLAYRMRTSFSDQDINKNQKGYSRWTTDEELKKQYKRVPDRDKPFPGYGGAIISRIGLYLFIDDDMVNNLYIGITRSGKTELFVIPSIDVYSRAKKKTSMVILDPKTELYKTSKVTLEKRGYRVFLLSLVDPLHSMGFNPLNQIIKLWQEKDFANAELLAQTFSYSIFNPDQSLNGDAFWNDASSSLLTALILAHIDDCQRQDERDGTHCQIKKVNMFSIINLFGELVTIKNPKDPDITALDEYFNRRPPLDRAKLKYFGVTVAADRTKGSIFSTMLNKLTLFTYENIAKMTAESTLDLEDIGFGDKPVAVFLEIPDYDKSTHFLASVFIRQMYFVLAKRATRESTGRCKNRVRVIADECGNIPAIEALEQMVTVGLGRNIGFDFYIHTDAQLEKLYGENARTIAGNCGNTIYILSDDDDTTKRFSDNLGPETILDLQRSGERLSMNKTLTETPTEKSLLTFNQLEVLKPGECVVRRTMKRTDLKGKKITPHPILNAIENGRQMLFRYEYLTDTFPNPSEVDLAVINTEDRSHIKLQERIWYPAMTWKLYGWAGGTVKGTGTSSGRRRAKKNKSVGKLVSPAVLEAIQEQLGGEIPPEMEVGELEENIKKAGLDEETEKMLLKFLDKSIQNQTEPAEPAASDWR